MSNPSWVTLKGLMFDGLVLSGVTVPTPADVERGCVAPTDGVAEYREGSRVRVRIRTRPRDRRLEANVDGVLHDMDEPGSRDKAVAAVAAMFRG